MRLLIFGLSRPARKAERLGMHVCSLFQVHGVDCALQAQILEDSCSGVALQEEVLALPSESAVASEVGADDGDAGEALAVDL